MAGQCFAQSAIACCDQIVTGIVNGWVYNMNSWILNLQFSVVVPVIFVLKVYWGSISHDMVKLCLTKKIFINAAARTKLSTHILRCLTWKIIYSNNYKYTNYVLTPLIFHSFLSAGCFSFFWLILCWVFCQSGLCCPQSLHSWFLVSLLLWTAGLLPSVTIISTSHSGRFYMVFQFHSLMVNIR